LLLLQRSSDISIPNVLILLNTLRYSGMRNAIGIWSSTNHLEEEQTGSNTERWYKQIFFDNRIQEIALTNKRF